MNIQARFDLETAEDVLAPQIRKIASYKAAIDAAMWIAQSPPDSDRA
jgi:hypothetical protein